MKGSSFFTLILFLAALTGIPWTGLENPSPEIQALARPKLDLKMVPFDPLEYVEHLDELPFDPGMDPDVSR